MFPSSIIDLPSTDMLYQNAIEAEKSAKQTEHTQWRAIPEKLGMLK